MTPTTPRERADARLEQALRDSGARDPREFYRERLRELKGRSPEAYQEALRHFDDVLVPSVAAGEAEPLTAWTDYGRRLAELSAPGRTVTIDPTGRAEPFHSPAPSDALVLHLPEGGGRALLVGLPRTPSEAQRATYEWLVGGRQRLREDAGS